MLETHFRFGFPNGSPIGDSLTIAGDVDVFVLFACTHGEFAFDRDLFPFVYIERRTSSYPFLYEAHAIVRSGGRIVYVFCVK